MTDRESGPQSGPVSEGSTSSVGLEMYALMKSLYPICRSITGAGVRETLSILQTVVPIEIHEVPSGTQVFDWTVPNEWNIEDAYVKNSRGEKLIDFSASNLHVVSYSRPVHRTMGLSDLKQHLHSLPEHPDWTPYRTTYYRDNWGFCLPHRRLLELEEDQYEVFVGSTLEPGSLTYGELLIPGETTDEILVSCHICHPSLCNDNLSGIALATFLARKLRQAPTRYSYRFLFVPGTIGSISWLALNEQSAASIRHGLVLTCVGDGGGFTYKKSRRGDTEIDRVAAHVLKHSALDHEIVDFSPYGYDERQYCSPGFDLAVGCLMRSPHGSFPEYHTSADDMSLVRPTYLAESYDTCLDVFGALECNRRYQNLNPKCEPQLGKRGLYKSMGGHASGASREMAMLWVLNQSDGRHSLLDIAERSGLPIDALSRAAEALVEHELLETIPPEHASC